jgi:hypothetical protein
MGGKGGGGEGGGGDRAANMAARGIDPDKWANDMTYNQAVRANGLYGLDRNPDGSVKAAPVVIDDSGMKPEPEPEPEAPHDPLGPPISSGEPIEQPSTNSPFGVGAMMNTGDALSGAVKQPTFWMGNLAKNAKAGQRMTTTQT